MSSRLPVRSGAGDSVSTLAASLQQQYRIDTRMPRRKRRARGDGVSSGSSSSTSASSGPAPSAAARRVSAATAAAGLRVRMAPSEWEAVHARCRARDASAWHQCCPICQERWRSRPQALLSCSHVFHDVCLRSFEQFVTRRRRNASLVGGRDAEAAARVCPVCRAADYDKKIIDDGAREWYARCIVVVQALARRRAARRRFIALVESIPPPKTEAARRREWYLRKLARTTASYQTMSADKDAAIDALFADCDRSVRALQTATARYRDAPSGEWEQVAATARARGADDCAICMLALPPVPEWGGGGAPAPPPEAGGGSSAPAVLLSCSHVMHAACLRSFETFALSGSLAASGADAMAVAAAPLGCPICRASYRKVPFEELCGH